MEKENMPLIHDSVSEKDTLPSVLDIAVISLPHTACLSDLAPLSAVGGVELRFVSAPAELKCPDLIVLPGSESSLEDLLWLHEVGLAEVIKTSASADTPIVGICAGYQLLGEQVSDDAASAEGLCLLPVVTNFSAEECRTQSGGKIIAAEGCFSALSGAALTGYETHFGRTTLAPGARHFAELSDGTLDGCVSGSIIGTYLHGIFDDDELRKRLLFALCERRGLPRRSISFPHFNAASRKLSVAERGLTHLYTGDGKGKTTAALGLALRFAGHGKRVIIVQLLKGSDSGELHALSALPEIRVLRNSRDYGFWSSMTAQQQSACRAENNANLASAATAAGNGECELLILDEVTSAYELEAASLKLIEDIVLNKPEALELVLTGRNAPCLMRSAADYISDIQCVRHPYEKGVQAREGAEF